MIFAGGHFDVVKKLLDAGASASDENKVRKNELPNHTPRYRLPKAKKNLQAKRPFLCSFLANFLNKTQENISSPKIEFCAE